jgi:Na+-transporting methylmalonyl-CoA/oxaloacetate decarboxylase gamma subunit
MDEMLSWICKLLTDLGIGIGMVFIWSLIFVMWVVVSIKNSAEEARDEDKEDRK